MLLPANLWLPRLYLWLGLLTRDSLYTDRRLRDAALADADDRLRRNPRDAAARADRGRALLLFDRNGEAFAEFEDAVESDPGDAHARLCRATYRIDTGRPAEALIDLDEAAVAGPSALGCFLRNAALWNVGRREEALACLREAVRLDPRRRDWRALNGGLLADMGRHDEGAAELEAILAGDGRDIEARIRLAQVCLSAGRSEDALHAARLVLRRLPEQPIALAVAGEALVKLDRPEGVGDMLAHAERLAPGNAYVRQTRVAVLLRLGRYADVLELSRETPADPVAAAACLLNRASAFEGLGDFAAMLAEADAAIALAPELAGPRAARSVALGLLDRHAEAVAEAEFATRREPGCAYFWEVLGVGRAKSGAYAEAVAAYNRSLALNPAGAHAHFLRGCAASRVRDPDAALAGWEEALHREPGNPNYANNVAWGLATHPVAARRDPARALQLARRAAAAPGRMRGSASSTLAAAFAADGDFAHAREWIGRALAEPGLTAEERSKCEAQAAAYARGQVWCEVL